MNDKEFEQLVAEGIEAIPEHIQRYMKNVAVVIEDEPSLDDTEGNGYGSGGMVFGLYQGVPLTERGAEYGEVLPDKITIFKNPILAVYRDPKDIKQCVENTVWHEIAHHFGHGEEWVEAEEQRRGKTL